MSTLPRRRARRGANAIEFALTFPFLLLLMTGIMDFGYFEMVRFAADSTARDAARAGAIGADDSLTVAQDTWAAFGLPGATPTIVSYRTGSPLVQVVRVQVRMPALIGFAIGPQTLEVVATRRVES